MMSRNRGSETVRRDEHAYQKSDTVSYELYFVLSRVLMQLTISLHGLWMRTLKLQESMLQEWTNAEEIVDTAGLDFEQQNAGLQTDWKHVGVLVEVVASC